MIGLHITNGIRKPDQYHNKDSTSRARATGGTGTRDLPAARVAGGTGIRSLPAVRKTVSKKLLAVKILKSKLLQLRS